MVSTTGGRRPSRPRACRSGRVNAVPLFSAGVSRRTCPRRCGGSLVKGEEGDAAAIRTSRKAEDSFKAQTEEGSPAEITPIQEPAYHNRLGGVKREGRIHRV